MFANNLTNSQRFRARAVLAGLLAFSFALPVAASASEPAASWWVEVIREREIPTALIAVRKAAAAEEARKAKEEDEKVEPGAKGKVKALFKALKKVKPAADKEADKEAEEDAEKDEKAAEVTVDEEAPKVVAAADATGPKGDGEVPDEAAAVDPPAGEAPAKAPPVAEAVEEEAMTISITVAMAGEVVGLNNSSLMFRPAVQPDQVLELPLKQVASLSRHAPGNAPAAEDPDDLEFRVVLRDGSEVPGQLMNLSDKAITVALVGSGAKIDLPLGEITRVERNVPIGKAAGADLPEFPGRHIAMLSTGEVVAGQLLPSRDSDKWLRISSPILTAECPLSLIDLLIFPDPEAPAGGAEEALADEVVTEDDGGNNGNPAAPKAEPETVPEPDVEPEPDIRHLVSLTPAGMLWAKSLKVEGDNLLVSALGKESFSVPLDRVESVSFGHDGLPTTAPVLIWGGYSDADDEYKKTVDALAGRIPARKLIQNKSKVPDADFMRHLRRARVLLVPEMESFKRTQLKEAMDKDGKGCPSWKDAFRGFLRRGGSIIFLSPTGEALNFFNESGLGPLRSGGSGSGWEITADGKKLGAKVGGTIANVNATHYFRKGEPWQVWGAAKGGGDGAVLLGRRLERGWVMAFGADFYETNKDLTETLVRMIEFRGRR